jgi:elongation factor 3
MAPALDLQQKSAASAVKAENAKSVKILDELLAKLTISKSQDEINESAQEIASFINGDIEEGDVPTK